MTMISHRTSTPALRAALLSASLLLACQRSMDRAPLRSAPSVQPSDPVKPQRDLALLREPGDRPVDKQIAQLQEHARRVPDKIDTWVLLGRAFVQKARESADPSYYRNADACVDVALALEPESAMALDLRGLALMNEHRFAAARDLAQRLTRQHPEDATAWGTLSDAQLELGRYDEAIDAMQRMQAVKPNLPSYIRASYLAWLSGNDAAAKMAIRHAIDAAPTSSKDPEPRAYALTQAALYFWHQGDYEGADVGLQMALQQFPGFPAALVGRAKVALAQGRAKDAAELLAQAYEQSPLVETGWLLGDARTLAGDAAGAQAAYARIERQGQRVDPRTLGLYYATKGHNLDQALSLLSEERKQRQDIYTQDAYAFALHRAGRSAEALPISQQVLRLGTRDAMLLYHAGAIRLAAGQRAEGEKLLNEALKLNPGFDVLSAREARRLLGPPEAGAAPGTIAQAAGRGR